LPTFAPPNQEKHLVAIKNYIEPILQEYHDIELGKTTLCRMNCNMMHLEVLKKYLLLQWSLPCDDACNMVDNPCNPCKPLVTTNPRGAYILLSKQHAFNLVSSKTAQDVMHILHVHQLATFQ
jgi:hypothetical protein